MTLEQIKKQIGQSEVQFNALTLVENESITASGNTLTINGTTKYVPKGGSAMIKITQSVGNIYNLLFVGFENDNILIDESNVTEGTHWLFFINTEAGWLVNSSTLNGNTSTPSTPDPILELDGLISYHNIEDDTSFIPDGSDLVNLVQDQTDNNIDLQNANPSDEHPLYDDILQQLTFTDDRLNYTSGHDLIGNAIDFTLIAKLNITEITDQCILSSNRTSNDRVGLSIRNGNIAFGGYTTNWNTAHGSATTGVKSIIAYNDGGSYALRVNGVELTGSNQTIFTATATDFITIGATAPTSGLSIPFKGGLIKIALVSRLLTPAEIQDIETYLMS